MTLLPALAAILGITVDELLAGEVRGEAQAASGDRERTCGRRPTRPTRCGSDAAEKPDGVQTAACCLPAVSGRWAFVWYAVSLGMQGIFRLALLCILFAACAVWHSGKVRKLSRYAAPDDLRTSRRRTGLLLGGYAAVALLFGGMVIAPAFSEYLRFERGRYEIVLEMNQFQWGPDAWTAAGCCLPRLVRWHTAVFA